MPHTYLEDVKEIVTALSGDEELILEEKLFALGLMGDYINTVTTELEGELAAEEGVGE